MKDNVVLNLDGYDVVNREWLNKTRIHITTLEAKNIYLRDLHEGHIVKKCNKCNGAGMRGYPSTATWTGGIGGQSLTHDICDECWGTGCLMYSGVNLRNLFIDMKKNTNDNEQLRIRLKEQKADFVAKLAAAQKEYNNE